MAPEMKIIGTAWVSIPVTCIMVAYSFSQTLSFDGGFEQQHSHAIQSTSHEKTLSISMMA